MHSNVRVKCPTCREVLSCRTDNLTRHMNTKHPGVKLPTPSELDLVFGEETRSSRSVTGSNGTPGEPVLGHALQPLAERLSSIEVDEQNIDPALQSGSHSLPSAPSTTTSSRLHSSWADVASGSSRSYSTAPTIVTSTPSTDRLANVKRSRHHDKSNNASSSEDLRRIGGGKSTKNPRRRECVMACGSSILPTTSFGGLSSNRHMTGHGQARGQSSSSESLPLRPKKPAK